MKYTIPTPVEFLDPTSVFNNPPQKDPIEELIKIIFSKVTPSSLSIITDELGPYKYEHLTVAMDAMREQGWHVGLKKFPDEPMGTMLMPGFLVLVLAPKDSMTNEAFAQSLLVQEEIVS